MKKEFSTMTDDELQAARQDLANKRDDIKAQQRLVVAEIENRGLTKRAKETVARMTPAEKGALLQVVRPEGIESAEVFGPDK